MSPKKFKRDKNGDKVPVPLSLYIQAITKTYAMLGKPPCPFSWFAMGSAGRFEQGFMSDQDHGIVYQMNNNQFDHYFQELGKEISYGLHVAGYPYCEGRVMSSNPLWCKSLDNWRAQISLWADDASLESIRYLQIFFDARNLFGEPEYIQQLKNHFFGQFIQNTDLISRFLE